MKINGIQVIAIYGGRFQPMGLHHKMTYEWMVNTFGYENSFVVSAGTKIDVKNPLLFNEKKMVAMAHGIPEEKFIYEKVPYVWRTWKTIPVILKERGLSISNILLFYVVGEKDMIKDPRFTPYIKKNGQPSYFQHYIPNTQLSMGDVHGYLAVAPHMEFSLPNGEESSGTKLREFLVNADPGEFEKAMGFYDPEIDNMLKSKISAVIQDPGSLKEEIKRRERGTKEYSDYLEEIMNELQHIKKEYGSRRKENYKFRKEASKIQDAYSEIKRLKRNNDKKFSEEAILSERAVRSATGYDDYEDKDKEFNRDSIRDFFDKFK